MVNFHITTDIVEMSMIWHSVLQEVSISTMLLIPSFTPSSQYVAPRQGRQYMSFCKSSNIISFYINEIVSNLCIYPFTLVQIYHDVESRPSIVAGQWLSFKCVCPFLCFFHWNWKCSWKNEYATVLNHTKRINFILHMSEISLSTHWTFFSHLLPAFCSLRTLKSLWFWSTNTYAKRGQVLGNARVS